MDSLFELVSGSIAASATSSGNSSVVFNSTYLIDMRRLFTHGEDYFPDAQVYCHSTQEGPLSQDKQLIQPANAASLDDSNEWVKVFSGHKLIFSCRSEFFAHTFAAGMSESGALFLPFSHPCF